MKNKIIVLVIATAILSGAGGFLGGTKYSEQKRPAFTQQFGPSGNRMSQRLGGQNGNNGNFQPVRGEIIEIGNESITVKLDDGSSKIVLLSESTSINKAESKTKEDLKAGEKVMIIGTTNSDGIVNAQNIQMNPQERVFIQNKEN